MALKRFSVLDLLGLNLKEHDSLDLRSICGARGLNREITIPDLNRPGLALSGFYDSFAYQRVQLFGRGEVAFLGKLASENKLETIQQMLSYQLPCCIFTHNLEPPKGFLDIAEETGCAILQTGLDSSEFSSRLLRILSNIFAPKISIHGVFVEVYGLGI